MTCFMNKSYMCGMMKSQFLCFIHFLLISKAKSAKLLLKVICDSGISVVWWRHKSRDYINFFILLVSCLFRRILKANRSKMPQGNVLRDDVTSDVTILGLVILFISWLFRNIWLHYYTGWLLFGFHVAEPYILCLKEPYILCLKQYV